MVMKQMPHKRVFCANILRRIIMLVKLQLRGPIHLYFPGKLYTDKYTIHKLKSKQDFKSIYSPAHEIPDHISMTYNELVAVFLLTSICAVNIFPESTFDSWVVFEKLLKTKKTRHKSLAYLYQQTVTFHKSLTTLPGWNKEIYRSMDFYTPSVEI